MRRRWPGGPRSAAPASSRAVRRGTPTASLSACPPAPCRRMLAEPETSEHRPDSSARALVRRCRSGGHPQEGHGLLDLRPVEEPLGTAQLERHASRCKRLLITAGHRVNPDEDGDLAWRRSSCFQNGSLSSDITHLLLYIH